MFNHLLYRIGRVIALSLPLRLSYRLAVYVSDIHYIFSHKDRKIVTENLKVIFPNKTDREIKRIRIQVFRNFAKYLVDFFRLESLDTQQIKKRIKIENINYLDESISRGKGTIILSAHLGNWELGAALVSSLGYPMWVVALEHKEKKINDFFNFQRQSKGIGVIPLSRAVKACIKLLKENNVIGLVGDRSFSDNGVVVDFFGKDTLFPEGPAVLSLRTGATLLPVFMLRNDDDTFTLKIERPLEFSPCGDKDNNIKAIVGLYKAIFEDYIRRYPQLWYMFRRFWKE